MKGKADIGLIGLAVMGQNLVLNMAENGFTVAVYNRTEAKTRGFISGPATDFRNIKPTFTLEELVGSLKIPRRIMLMVKAGEVVDHFIEQLIPLLDRGDIIIDGGNSYYPDTARRTGYLESKGLLFIGSGVSGGEEGARHGPSIMPGGSRTAWPHVKPIFQAIAAKVPSGEACADWVGDGGAGHYVKMVHNGIEYGDMQLISEAYHLMKDGLGMSNEEMHRVFTRWNSTELDSYLIEITADILTKTYDDGTYVIDTVLDAAGQKGTGKWTGINALDAGIPVTLIVEAVFARSLSALKEERVSASSILPGPKNTFTGDRNAFVDDLEKALLAAKIISYAQGFMLIREASDVNNWNINYGNVALLWREGCIIRSVFLGKIKEAFDKNHELKNLLLDDYFSGLIDESQHAWRRVVAKAVEIGIPVPTLSAALSFYDGYRNARLPANMIQAQRDYFGAHTFERIDGKRGEFHHFDWIGSGGSATSGTYNA